MAALDFPFGQPRGLASALGWDGGSTFGRSGGGSWQGMVEAAAALPPTAYEAALKGFVDGQPPGLKHLKRACAAYTREVSPTSLVRTPTAKVFHVGAPVLAQSACHVVPGRPIHPCGSTSTQEVQQQPARVAMEAYPALVARRCTGTPRASYKGDSSRDGQCAERRAQRQATCDAITGDAITGGAAATVALQLRRKFGFTVRLPAALLELCIDDGSGDDGLDAVLAGMQAGWAAARQGQLRNWGVPLSADPLEGWVADPATSGTVGGGGEGGAGSGGGGRAATQDDCGKQDITVGGGMGGVVGGGGVGGDAVPGRANGRPSSRPGGMLPKRRRGRA